MGHIDISDEVTIRALTKSGHWVLRYHQAADELCLYDNDGLLLAGLPGGSAEITRLSEAMGDQRHGPVGVFLPAVDRDLGWSILFFPGSGHLVLHNPLGEAVGGTDQGRRVVVALRDAL